MPFKIKVPELYKLQKELTISMQELKLPSPRLLRITQDRLSRTFEKKIYYNSDLRELMPNLYKDHAAGVKNSTYYQRKTEKPTEPFIYDAADLLRRAHIQEKGSVLLSHVNRTKQGKFKN